MSAPRRYDSRLDHREANMQVMIFGDMKLFDRQTLRARLQLPIAASPVGPNGKPKLEHQPPPEHPHRRHNFPFLGAKVKEEGIEEEGMVYLDVNFMTYIQESHHFYLRVILSLNLGDVIVICYDPLEPQTLQNAIYRWHPFVLHFIAPAPVFLVECHLKPQTSLDSSQQRPTVNQSTVVSRQEAEDACSRIGAVALIEWHEPDQTFVEMAEEALVWYGYYFHLTKVQEGEQWERRQRRLRRWNRLVSYFKHPAW